MTPSGSFFRGSLQVNLMIAILVPACGYFGTKNSDPNLLLAFCCCSGCGAINVIFSMCAQQGALEFRSGAAAGIFCMSSQLVSFPLRSTKTLQVEKRFDESQYTLLDPKSKRVFSTP